MDDHCVITVGAIDGEATGDSKAAEPHLLPEGLAPRERIAVPGDIGRAAEEVHAEILADARGRGAAGWIEPMDSAGIGELVACHKRAVEKGGVIKILKPNEKLLDLFTITKLIEIFDIFDNEKDAVKSF